MTNDPILGMPGGSISGRPLHFIWIADCSGSMYADGKMQALNSAIKESIPHMQQIADSNPHAELLIRAISFSTGAQWHVSQPTPVDEFRWIDLESDGGTDMGLALSMVAEQLKMPPMSDRALPPVLVLLSDGQATDDVKPGLKALHSLPWGKKAVKVAIAIGDDADLDILQQFMNSEIKPLQANNPEALVRHIKWASTAVLKAVSSPVSKAIGGSAPKGNVVLPEPPDVSSIISSTAW